MEIQQSDEQFEDLSMSGPKNLNHQSEIGDETGVIRENEKSYHFEETYRVNIIALQGSPEINIFEKQEYSVNVFRKNEVITKDIKRRFSDFAIFFDALFRNYKGYIFPGFPKNQLMSFVKSKVPLTKDIQYLKDRMKMVQRFLAHLLNMNNNFSIESCPQMRKFLSENQFDMFKKAQKQKSQSILGTSWNKLIGYIKLGKQNRYKIISDQLNQNKKRFWDLYQSIKQMNLLLKHEITQYQNFSEKKLEFYKSQKYCQSILKIRDYQKENIHSLGQLEFELFCENQDFIMVLKMIDTIQEVRNSDMSTKQVKKIDDTFEKQYNQFKNRKDYFFQKFHDSFVTVLKQIKIKDLSFASEKLEKGL